jgi:hypothetical protein
VLPHKLDRSKLPVPVLEHGLVGAFWFGLVRVSFDASLEPQTSNKAAAQPVLPVLYRYKQQGKAPVPPSCDSHVSKPDPRRPVHTHEYNGHRGAELK